MIPSVKIGPHTITIHQMSTSEALAQGIHGSFSEIEGCIRLNTDRAMSSVIDTLMHEIIHGMYSVYSLCDEDDEERTVSVLGTGMAALFIDNPDLLKLVSKCK